MEGAFPDNKQRARKRKGKESKRENQSFTGRGCRKCQPAPPGQSRPRFSPQPTGLLAAKRSSAVRGAEDARRGKELLTGLAPSRTMHPSARPVYYGVVFAWYVFFFYASAYFLGSSDKSRTATGRFNPFWGSQWKYLSFLNVVLQVIFYAVSLLTSAFILMKKRRLAKTMISLKDLIFSSLVFPLSTFVFATFWSIYLYDRELVYPKYRDSIIPQWVNHGMHTLVFPLALVEMFVTHHKYPSVCKSLSIFGMISLAYLLWILYFFAKTGKWLYPFFKFLSPLSIIVFAGIALVTLFFSYILGRFLNCVIWGNAVPGLDVHKKKRK